MPSPPARIHTSPEAASRSRRLTLVAAISIVVATAMNLGLYAIGRGTDAALKVDPGVGEPNHLVIAPDVAWKTAVPLALGALVLALIARRSRHWTTIVIVAGAAVAVISIPFVFVGAHDTVTGVLLLSMQAVTGLAFVVIGTRARLNATA